MMCALSSFHTGRDKFLLNDRYVLSGSALYFDSYYDRKKECLVSWCCLSLSVELLIAFCHFLLIIGLSLPLKWVNVATELCGDYLDENM